MIASNLMKRAKERFMTGDSLAVVLTAPQIRALVQSARPADRRLYFPAAFTQRLGGGEGCAAP